MTEELAPVHMLKFAEWLPQRIYSTKGEGKRQGRTQKFWKEGYMCAHIQTTPKPHPLKIGINSLATEKAN